MRIKGVEFSEETIVKWAEDAGVRFDKPKPKFEPIKGIWWEIKVDMTLAYPIIISLIEPFCDDAKNKYQHRIFGVDNAKKFIKEVKTAINFVEANK